jgi:hypothetical protein
MNFDRVETLKLAESVGLGFYRVIKEGNFTQSNSIAKSIFEISEQETNIPKYSIADFYMALADFGIPGDQIIYKSNSDLTTFPLLIKRIEEDECIER